MPTFFATWSRREYAAAAVFAVLLTVYLFFGLAWISLPGPDADEVLFISVWYVHSPLSFHLDKVRIFETDVLTMLGTYNGALKGWLWSLFFLLGRSIYTVRIPAVLLGALTLALFFGWTRRLYPISTVCLALLLAATDPTYVNSSRIDYGPVVLQRLLLIAGVFAGTKWLLLPAQRAWSHGWLAAAGFCLGLALWDKTTFGWCLIALTLAVAVLFPRDLWRLLPPAPAVAFLFFFLLGALPLLIFNLRSGGGTGEHTRLESFDRDTWQRKYSDFRLTLNGRYLHESMGGRLPGSGQAANLDDVGQRFLNALGWFAHTQGTLFPWAIAATAGVGLAALWRGNKALLFPMLLSLFHWAEVFLTRGAGGPHHTTLIYPFPHLAVAASAVWLWQGASRWPAAAAGVSRGILALALAATAVSQVGYNARQLSSFRQVRGSGIWTDAIYAIAEYLKDSRTGLVVNMDWGFGPPLLLLTDDGVRQIDFYTKVWGNHGEPALIDELAPLLARPGTVFLFHAPPFTQFPAVKVIFEKAVAKSGKRSALVRTFFQGTGEPVAHLLRVD